MVFKHGRHTELWLDQFDVTEYFNALDGAAEVDTADTTTFRKVAKTHVVGTYGVEVSGAGFYDPNAGTGGDPSDPPSGPAGMTRIAEHMLGRPAQPDTSISASTAGILTYGLGGLEFGDRARLVNVAETAYKETSKLGDAVGFTWAALAQGRVGFGHVLWPMVETVTAGIGAINGATFDGGASAASSTGAVAHLHVITTGLPVETVVKIQDASVPSGGGANWADIGEFTLPMTLESPLAERLEITGDVRRYLRAVVDMSSSDPETFTLGVAFARVTDLPATGPM